MGNKVAILLAGSGYLDGAEINEAVLCNLALRVHGFETEFFSINSTQMHVVNHLEAKPVDGQMRHTLEESARIARGAVWPIEDLDLSRFDALALPGGYGVAKNFCDFALKGAEASVHPAIESLLTRAFDSSKPILAICIAPALLGLVAYKQKRLLNITLGDASNDASMAMKTLGHSVVTKQTHEFLVDDKNFVISTPAYMYETQPEQVWLGLQACVQKLVEWIKKR